MKKKLTFLLATGLLAGTLAFSSCDDKDENTDRDGDRNFGTTGTGSGTGLNSDFDNNSTTGAIDPGQEQYEKENESHINNASTSNIDTAHHTTSNTGTRVGPTGGHHSTGGPATTGQTTHNSHDDHSTR